MMRNRDKPAQPATQETFDTPGLTKREAAAIAVVQGMWASQFLWNQAVEQANKKKCGCGGFDVMAGWAVDQADALFDALEKGDD